MITTDYILGRLTRRIVSRNASSFFINGAPDSGKSHLLGTLREQLPVYVPNCLVLGPYVLPTASAEELFKDVLRDCRGYGLIEVAEREIPSGMDLAAGLSWLCECRQLDIGKNLVILIDLGQAGTTQSAETISALFSNLRYIDGKWDRSRPRIHTVLAGYWSHNSLTSHYDRIETSYPYTVDFNYLIWDGMNVDETVALFRRMRPHEDVPDIFAAALQELTSGHAGVTSNVLTRLSGQPVTLHNILRALMEIAEKSHTSTLLVEAWKHLGPSAQTTLRRLMSKRHVQLTALDTDYDALLTAGIARLEKLGPELYLGFASWFVEQTLRLHLQEVSLLDEQTARVKLDSLMPTISVVNREAYRLINEIENAARNFAAILLQERPVACEHFLQGHVPKKDEKRMTYVDAYKRALDWQKRSSGNGLAPAINPLIAYTSTSDLASLIGEIAAEIKSSDWSQIELSLVDLAPVRNAVMHNQLIDDEALGRLRSLKEDIYVALNGKDG